MATQHKHTPVVEQRPQTVQQNGSVVFDVDERNFEEAVLVRSREVPVVVDFWAPWCGPCRTLGPILERLAHASGGSFVLAKVNVDTNQRLAAAFRVQGIPAVKAFHNGQLIDEFTGALPESRVRTWLKRFVPEPQDSLVAAAAALEATNPAEAAARYRLALGDDPTDETALFGLGRLLVMQGDAEGEAVLKEVPLGTPFYARAQALLSLVDFFNNAQGSDFDALEQRISTNSGDTEARYQLAALQAQQGRYTDAMDNLIAVVSRDRALHHDGGRKALLALFALLGDENPQVGPYRRKLANVLF